MLEATGEPLSRSDKCHLPNPTKQNCKPFRRRALTASRLIPEAGTQNLPTGSAGYHTLHANAEPLQSSLSLLLMHLSSARDA